MGNIITKISTEEAFELGRVEGLKEILREIKEICNADDAQFIRAYVKARLKSLEDTSKIKKSLKSE